MKTPKIVNSLQHLDDGMIVASEKKRALVKRPNWMRWVAMAAAFVLIAGALVIGVQLATPGRGNTVIALDVNPSMEIEIDENDRVVAIKALNTDAETVLSGMDFAGADINLTVNAIIGSMLKNGYLTVDRNSILVSVNSGDTQKATDLQALIAGDIEATLKKSNIEASVMLQDYKENAEIKKLAEKYDISTAKAALLQRVVSAGLKDAKGVAYTYEMLAPMKVHELRILLESKGLEVDGVRASGKAHNPNYIGEEKALKEALKHAELTEDTVRRIEIELDFERGRMVYSVEFETAEFEYEYELDAETGEILEVEKEAEDDDDD